MGLGFTLGKMWTFNFGKISFNAILTPKIFYLFSNEQKIYYYKNKLQIKFNLYFFPILKGVTLMSPGLANVLLSIEIANY